MATHRVEWPQNDTLLNYEKKKIGLYFPRFEFRCAKEEEQDHISNIAHTQRKFEKINT